MKFLLWRQHQKDNGITPNQMDGYVSANSIDDARLKLKLGFSCPRLVQGKKVTGYKKTARHKTVFYLIKVPEIFSGKEITSI